MHIYIYWNIYNSKAVNSYSTALYQLCQLSLESPHHCDFNCLTGSSMWHIGCRHLRSNTESFCFFCFFCFFLFLFFPMRSSSSLFHWYVVGSCAWWCSVLYAHMAHLRTVPPPPFFESLLTSSSSSWFFIICSEHMTLSIPLLHHPPDLMAWWFLALLAMSILLYWMASPVVWLVPLVVPDCMLSALSILLLWWFVPPLLFLMPLWMDTTTWALTVLVCPSCHDSPVCKSKPLPA